MIDFQREEADLSAAVGLSSEAIAGELGAECARQLAQARRRYLAYSGSAAEALDRAERLERDRLDSLLQHLYGPRGLLARAGALLSLKARLDRVAGAAFLCLKSHDAADRLRRESLILRAFAREQVARGRGALEAEVAIAADATARAVARLHDFRAALAAVEHDHSAFRRARTFSSVADLADDHPNPKTIGDAIAFVLHRLADSATLGAVSAHFDSLCVRHAAFLREELWDAAEAAFSRRETPAGLRELGDLDLVLEALHTKLVDAKVDGAERCAAIAQLYALVASSRAADAASRAEAALAPLRELITHGVEAEAHS